MKTLIDACDAQSLEDVKCLVDKGAKINAIHEEHKMAVLEYACMARCSLKIIKYLLDNKADVNAINYKLGTTPLIRALNCKRSFEIIKCLINHGADVNYIDNIHKWSVFMHACTTGCSLKIIKYLANVGSNLSALTDEKETTLMRACAGVRVDCRKHASTATPLCVDDPAVQMLLALQGFECPPPLGLGSVDVVEFLINSGIDINAVNCDGWTVLMYACNNQGPDIIKRLVSRGAEINAVNNHKWTALMHACTHQTLDVIAHLIEKGAKVNIVNKDGVTALGFACSRNKSLTVIKILVKNSATFDEEILKYCHLHEVCNFLEKLLLSKFLLLKAFSKGNVNKCIKIIDECEYINQSQNGMNLITHLLVGISSELSGENLSNTRLRRGINQIKILLHFLSKGPRLYDICNTNLCYKQYESITYKGKHVSVIDTVFMHFFKKLPDAKADESSFSYDEKGVCAILSSLCINNCPI